MMSVANMAHALRETYAFPVPAGVFLYGKTYSTSFCVCDVQLYECVWLTSDGSSSFGDLKPIPSPLLEAMLRRLGSLREAKFFLSSTSSTIHARVKVHVCARHVHESVLLLVGCVASRCSTWFRSAILRCFGSILRPGPSSIAVDV
jgi:hypothetical protein